jgi:lysophospholipase L1-like esterase
MKKRIVCFGDSNTWGYIPGGAGRYDENTRWTGVVQNALGSDYQIIEEGMNGRTSMFDDPWYPHRNGYRALDTILITKKPLDMFVIALGTNDVKAVKTAFGVRQGVSFIVSELLAANERLKYSDPIPVFENGPKILVLSPIHVRSDIAQINPDTYFGDVWGESYHFAEQFARIEERFPGVCVLDSAKYAEPSVVDGVHMDAESHKSLGLAVAAKISEMLKE